MKEKKVHFSVRYNNKPVFDTFIKTCDKKYLDYILDNKKGFGKSYFMWFLWVFNNLLKADLKSVDINKIRDLLLENYRKNDKHIDNILFFNDAINFTKKTGDKRKINKEILKFLKEHEFENNCLNKLNNKSVLNTNVKNYYCKIGDKKFKSAKEVADFYNVTVKSVNNKVLRNGKEMALEVWNRTKREACLENIKSVRKEFDCLGKHYNSIAEFCRLNNLNFRTFNDRKRYLKKYGEGRFLKDSVLNSVIAEVYLKKVKINDIFVFNNKVYFSKRDFFNDCSKLHNLERRVLEKRFYKCNWTFEEIYNNKRVDNNEIVKLG